LQNPSVVERKVFKKKSEKMILIGIKQKEPNWIKNLRLKWKSTNESFHNISENVGNEHLSRKLEIDGKYMQSIEMSFMI
jgi:hypothetical protein